MTSVKVLCIGSMPRSGSTLLDMMLGQMPGFFSGGELQKVWDRGLMDDVLCSCGQPFSECPFWNAVGRLGFAGWSIDRERMVHLKTRLQRHRSLPQIVSANRVPRFRQIIEEYTFSMARLYEAIQQASGCSTIVDSSKDPPHFFLLRETPGLDLRLVHLVRDPRGVVWSWMKQVSRPEVRERAAFLPKIRARKSVALWVDFNLMYHLLERMGVPRLFVRYESLVPSPDEHLARIAEFAGERLHGEAGVVKEGVFAAHDHHVIGGNPMRFRERMRLRVDDEWRQELSRNLSTAIYVATWPMLRTYGYVNGA